MSYPDYLCEFLQKSSRSIESSIPIAADMSERRYYRLPLENKLIMDATRTKDGFAFYERACYLASNDFRVPYVFEHNEDFSLLVVEDLGVTPFRHFLSLNERDLYKKYRILVDVLKKLVRDTSKKPSFLNDFSKENLLQGASLFIEWFWPLYFNDPPFHNACQEFKLILSDLFDTLPPVPHCFVLRDYHIDNVMVVREPFSLDTCGLIDFQDGLYGMCLYDVVSILEDARVSLPKGMKEQLFSDYLSDIHPSQHENYHLVFDFLSLIRHFNVMGVFARYFLRFDNATKLQHMARLWSYIDGSLENVYFVRMREWIETYFSDRESCFLSSKLWFSQPDAGCA